MAYFTLLGMTAMMMTMTTMMTTTMTTTSSLSMCVVIIHCCYIYDLFLQGTTYEVDPEQVLFMQNDRSVLLNLQKYLEDVKVIH